MSDSSIHEGLDKQSDLYPIAKEIMNLWAEAHSSNLSFSNEPKGHAFFIFPDGRFLSGFGAHYEIEEVIQALDKSNYPDVNISGDDYYIYSTLSDLGCVRGRFDKYENYFQLSQIRPTYEQYDSIEWALDIMQRQNISNRVFIETPNKGESKVYTFNDYTTDEIISKIKRYYTSGILYEGVENTVKNAIRQYDNYVRKYGEKEALFNLKYNYFLQDEELVYIINYLIKNNHMGNDIAKWNVEYLQLNDYISEIKFKTEDDNDDISLADIAKQYGVELKNSYENNSNLSELNEELKDRNWIINQFKIAFKKYMQNIPSADELFNKKLDNISESEWLDIEDFVESLKFPLVIYRGLKVNSPEEINKRDIGVNWTIDEELFFAPNSAFKGSNYVLATKVNENQVNFPETIQNFIYYSLRPQYGMYPEQEVTLNINPKLSDVVVLKKEGEELIPVTKLNLSEAYLDSEERFWDYGTGLITGNNVFDIGTNESSYGKKMIQYAESGKETSDGKRAAFIQLTPNEYFEACAEGFGNSVTSQIRQVADDEGVIDDLFTVIDVFERQFPVTYLDYSEDVFSQEGRHRMYVAGEKFGWNTKFPVLLIWKPGHKPSMGKETEEIQTFISNDELADELDYDDLEALDD